MAWTARKGWGPEDCIQADIVAALRDALPDDCIVMAIPNGANLTRAARGKLFGPMGAIAGAPDLLIMWPGGYGFLEVKAPKSYPRPEQKAFFERLTDIDAPCAVVCSPEEALRAISFWKAPVFGVTASYLEGSG